MTIELIIKTKFSHNCDFCLKEKKTFEIKDLPDVYWSLRICEDCLKKSGWELKCISKK